jgi:hypothetical protein
MIRVGQHEYGRREAQEVLAGYALGEHELNWNSTKRKSLGRAPEGAPMKARWAYRSYDCVPAAPFRLNNEDFAVTAGLNSLVGAKAILGMQSVSGEVSDALTRVPSWQTFWDLPRRHLGTEEPPQLTTAWWVRRAWAVLMGVPGADVAVVHKTLHHKRPWLFPLLDSLTVKEYPEGGAWLGIHDDLTSQERSFARLEQWFAVLAVRHDGAPLTRLRIHDILLWLECSGQRCEAVVAGQSILARIRS